MYSSFFILVPLNSIVFNKPSERYFKTILDIFVSVPLLFTGHSAEAAQYVLPRQWFEHWEENVHCAAMKLML